MFNIPLAFSSPWILGLLASLPVLWWLLRLTPPSPQKIIFPALSLLRDLVTPQQTPAHTPWWILLLRVLIGSLIIIAFAGPVINPAAVISGQGALLIVIDNDWASARAWDVRQQAIHDLLHEAERNNRQVLLLPTAPPATGEALKIIGPITAKAATNEVEHIIPQPWPAQWQQALALLQAPDHPVFADAVWMSSGLGDIDTRNLYGALKQGNSVKVLNDSATPIYLLSPPATTDDHLALTVRRAMTDDAATLSVAALSKDGRSIAQIPVQFAAGEPQAAAPLNLPLDIRNRIARFEIGGQHSAATTVLLDGSWQKRPVGLMGDRTLLAQHSLLNGLFYIDRALAPFADLHIDTLDNLLKQKLSVIILPDSATITDPQKAPLEAWVKKGGIVVRFAGEHMAAAVNGAPDDLLPVTLRNGDRAMGGSLSWATPQKLHDFPANSPFRGLNIPDDVTISRQVLAEPTEDLAAHSWATLADGTPLVTDKSIGDGLSVLFHVPARSDWSSLPLSGLFVDMLRRIIDVSHGVAADTNFTNLSPLRVLDAFGEEQKPGTAVLALSRDSTTHLSVGPQHPPGLYGTETLNVAFNLGDAITQPEAFNGVITAPYRAQTDELDLQPYVLMVAFFLMLADFIISLFLRGFIKLPTRKVTTLAVLLIMLSASARAATDTRSAVELTAQTYLAYVQTGDSETDHISQQGLSGLAQVLQARTSIDQIAVIGVNPDQDDLAFYPLLYWPLVAGATPLSSQGINHVNSYLHHGGMILFDSMNGEVLPAALMQRSLAGIDMPPLVPLPTEHVLKRSFYLLNQFTGRYDNSSFWLEPEDMSSYDGVATVLYGVDGWAAAWAMDDDGRPLYACMPGGEMQREMAYRFGVNLVMYALTGNYKSDQLHVQALLKRWGK